jgi:predicted nicotinamide N-methyase
VDPTAFVLEHTTLAPVPFVPAIRLHTATELVPLWRATWGWLPDERRGLEVPFWCVPWAGGQALARFVLDHPETVRGRRVVDFGAGSGLLAIAAALAGASEVRAVDVDPLATAACTLNAAANGVTRVIEAVCEDRVGAPLDRDTDVILAGDVWYERGASTRLSHWFTALAGRGVRILTGDPDRMYAPAKTAARELARYEVPTTAELESAPSRLARVLEFLG